MAGAPREHAHESVWVLRVSLSACGVQDCHSPNPGVGHLSLGHRPLGNLVKAEYLCPRKDTEANAQTDIPCTMGSGVSRSLLTSLGGV